MVAMDLDQALDQTVILIDGTPSGLDDDINKVAEKI